MSIHIFEYFEGKRRKKRKMQESTESVAMRNSCVEQNAIAGGNRIIIFSSYCFYYFFLHLFTHKDMWKIIMQNTITFKFTSIVDNIDLFIIIICSASTCLSSRTSCSDTFEENGKRKTKWYSVFIFLQLNYFLHNCPFYQFRLIYFLELEKVNLYW